MVIWSQDSYMCTINYTNCCRKFIHALPYPLGLHQFMRGGRVLDPFVRLCNYAVYNSIHSPRYHCLTNTKLLTNTLLISRVTEIA
ncbi:unnamed protein product [Acanthoscelides obtectus]|uniref:Uncharacterized protein n=1 Tax=Acanthoscelides obtectus TaxID=200917 RepID=A0A9P0Q820_ACAOB|nr:unnamed protein product [Acanthoscelides obtectus]CAK1631358.1 hypothetical protein AOBTE_LOCUS6904 [Acanthoscelides obtectus]